MNTIDDAAKSASDSISRQGGPWAWLAVFLVGCLVVAVGYVGRELVPVARDYITASTATTQSNAAAIASMTASMESVHKAHASMMAATEATQEVSVANGDKLDVLMRSVDQMAEIITEARSMMANVPQQRAEQTRLLQQIDESIRALAEELRRPPANGSG